MAERQPVVIVGAGIAGLTLALGLGRAGRPVTVLERASHLDEIGAGIQLSPNATRVLIELGLGDALRASAVAPARIDIRSGVTGRPIASLPLGAAIEARHGAPYWVIHRGDLQAALLSAVRATPAVTLELGVCLEGVVQTTDRVEADAFVGHDRRQVLGSALIGADGVWSGLRRMALGGASADYSGRTAFRATFPVGAYDGALRLGEATGLWLGPKAHLVHYPVHGGRDINLIAAVDDDWIGDAWDTAADGADLAAYFEGWPAEVRALLALPQSWRKWALCTAPTGGPWARGRVALIGDAAHGMLPFVAQGGAMAIEDAAVLTRHLLAAGDAVEPALAAYVAARRDRTLAVAQAARRNASIYHLSGLPARLRDLAMSALGPRRLIARMDWIWGWRDEPR